MKGASENNIINTLSLKWDSDIIYIYNSYKYIN